MTKIFTSALIMQSKYFWAIEYGGYLHQMAVLSKMAHFCETFWIWAENCILNIGLIFMADEISN